MSVPSQISQWNLIPWISEPFSSLSHFFGAVLFTVLGIWLLAKIRADRERLIYMSVFVFATVLLMTMSGIYHSMEPGTVSREVWVRMDVSAIFVLIAASFTFLHGCLFSGWRRWGILLLIWSIAVTGVFVTATFDHQSVKQATRFAFLGMGWIGLTSCGFLMRTYGRRVAEVLFMGGVVYTIGAIIDGVKWPVLVPGVVGPHEILHVMVLLGVSVFWYLAFQIAYDRIRELDNTDRPTRKMIAAEQSSGTPAQSSPARSTPEPNAPVAGTLAPSAKFKELVADELIAEERTVQRPKRLQSAASNADLCKSSP